MRYLRAWVILPFLILACSQCDAAKTDKKKAAAAAKPAETAAKPKEKPAAAAAPAPKPVPAAASAPAQAGAIDMPKLLNEMTDLRRLTKLPKPAYTTKQASSYDRASKSPTEDWFANGDAGQFIRTEDKDGRKENVMMDADGPGAIVRIWSANPEGALRIYLDGQDKPVIETKMDTFLGGKFEHVPRPIAGEYSKGWNSYLPIPYAKHCKVTSDAGGFYYHVNYRTYEAGTSVKTFSAADLTKFADKIADVAKRLDSPREGGGPPAERTKSSFDVSMAIEGEAELDFLKGSKAICGFHLHLTADDMVSAMRKTMLYMTFDNELTVKAPLGDFFGSFPGVNSYASLPLGVTEEKPADFWCHWWMPFHHDASISVRNFDNQRVDVKGEIAVIPYEWDDDTLVFHTTWKIERDVPSRPITDWNHLMVDGTGRFVGGALFITNSVRDWWGEGDEKIYVDGEKFPSHFGTGTEDYYGYAWCNPARFIHAYHNQPNCQGPGNYGNTSVNRFHIMDDIPFNKDFKFDIENWQGSDKPIAKTTRVAVSYWYARPGAKDHAPPLKNEDLFLPIVPPYVVEQVKGAQEAESLPVIEKKGAVGEQELGTGYSNEKQLWWRESKPGDKITIGFDAEAGKQHVIVKMTKAVDYATVQLHVNGQKAGNVIDLYHDGVTSTGEIDLGEFDLKKGQNTLTLEIVGANAAAAKAYMVGLDYVLLKGATATTQPK